MAAKLPALAAFKRHVYDRHKVSATGPASLVFFMMLTVSQWCPAEIRSFKENR